MSLSARAARVTVPRLGPMFSIRSQPNTATRIVLNIGPVSAFGRHGAAPRAHTPSRRPRAPPPPPLRSCRMRAARACAAFWACVTAAREVSLRAGSLGGGAGVTQALAPGPCKGRACPCSGRRRGGVTRTRSDEKSRGDKRVCRPVVFLRRFKAMGRGSGWPDQISRAVAGGADRAS